MACDSPYVRPAGLVILYPRTSEPWFGPGSQGPLELFDIVTKTGVYGTSSFSGSTDPVTGFEQADTRWVKDKYLAMMPSVTSEDMTKVLWPAGTYPSYTDQGTW